MGSLWSVLTGCGLLLTIAGVLGSWLGGGLSTPERRPAPERLTPAQAHEIMQAHRGCCADTCARKAAAFRALVDAGRIVPDSRAEGYTR
ncbi:hypothetical protein ACTD5D_06210 [Nocardia takedensis]|uniref:hypothetical protein n=1 Tax=Nocardia takedensis TaxID=259390 RepID=UPI0003008A67|nr:hypothetical protein [Nocardia takedensis]